MMGHRAAFKSGDECEYLTCTYRSFKLVRAGVRRAAKRKFNKRVRRLAKAECHV